MNQLNTHIEKLSSVREGDYFEQICAVYHAESAINSLPKEILSSDCLHIMREIHEIVYCIDSNKDKNINKYLVDALVLRIIEIQEELNNL